MEVLSVGLMRSNTTGNSAGLECLDILLRTLAVIVTGNLNHRWLKEWGVAVASEGKMRREAAEVVGDNIAAEVPPFTASRDNTVLQTSTICACPSPLGKV